jgi:Na+-translocating ferredoxin:NAD+ oxidoreductase subunit B
MNDDVYYRLAKVLDTLPNGFPPTESGVEIKLLKRVFTPEQADLFCDLRLTFETTREIADRTGRPFEGLKEQLMAMATAGQLLTIKLDKTRFFKMLPWVFGIYEFQLSRIDKAFAELVEEYWPIYSAQFFTNKPQLMQTLTVEEAIPFQQEALPYEKVSTIIENGQSFLLNECICKKERGLLGEPCDRPLEVCLAIAPIPGIFDKSPTGRIITKEDAYELLREAEDAGLVHLTGNVQVGQIYICNCCKCCCGVLRSINEFGIPAALVVNAHHYAKIDSETCIGCGICATERCQVGAIEESEDTYQAIPDRCIGCGLCISKCPTDAIQLVRKEQSALTPPPFTEDDWFKERGRMRGVDFAAHK